MDRKRPPRDDFNRPLPKQAPLPMLPEREWLKGRISKVEYEYVYFNNQIQYVTDKDGQPILDEAGEQIPRRQFMIEILLNEFNLPNGDPRRVWLRLGASMGGKAHLPQFLLNLEMEELNPTPKDIIDFLNERDVKFQLANKISQSSGKEYQQVIWDSVKPA
jgi:hypothetical protein